MKTAKQAINTNANIFRSNLNNKLKIRSFNNVFHNAGEVKYLPPVSKEWKNTIYSYYKKNMQNLPLDNINANRVIKSYFNLHFANNKFIGCKPISPLKRSLLLNKIYVSKMETKHTNSKTIITLYTINAEKKILENKYKDSALLLEDKVLSFFKNGLKQKIHGAGLSSSSHLTKTRALASAAAVAVKNEEIQDQRILLFSKYKYLTESLQCFNLYLRLYFCRYFKNSYFDKLDLLRKYQLNYYLNKFKFERNTYLLRLSNMLSRIFNKNIEFNIINLKSVAFNPDIFTEIVSLKLKKKKLVPRTIVAIMDSLFKVAKLPLIFRREEKIRIRDLSILGHSYSNLELAYLLNKNKNKSKNTSSRSCSLDSWLEKIYSMTTAGCGGSCEAAAPETSFTGSILKVNSQKIQRRRNISDIIFHSIKYKNLGGIRLEVKGRLTKRNRADRSIFKFKWKGGLKNIDSSFQNLSTVTYRGYYKPNVIYSLSKSKRRVGSFAVKGWISGK